MKLILLFWGAFTVLWFVMFWFSTKPVQVNKYDKMIVSTCSYAVVILALAGLSISVYFVTN